MESDRQMTWHSVLVVLLALVTMSHCRFLSPHVSLTGKLKKCSNEGEPVVVDLVAQNPCFQCFCRKGHVECDRTTCPSLQGCHAILFVRPLGSCCDQCKGCSFNGTTIAHGEISKSMHDPCQVHMCRAGVLTTSRDVCKPPCSNPAYSPGQCCPVCSGCSFQGRVYSNGQRFFPRHDQDVECSCSGGNISCVKRACPVLNCPQEYLYKVKGDRCPRCKGQRRVYALRKSCFFAKQVHADGDVTMLDSCTSCVCQKGTMACERKLCPEVSCPPSDRIFPAGECCPMCRERPVCQSGTKDYKHGEQWEEEGCKDCVCDNGRKWCRARTCPIRRGCPLGQRLTLLRGECCEECVRDEKVCTVSGTKFDSFKTFDGLRYNMTGHCKYSLLKDCRDNSISVKVRYKGNNSSSAISDVSITFGENRIKLYSNFKIRVNRTRLLSKTFVKPATFYVRVKPSYVVVHDRKSGVRVVWNMYSSLKVKVDNRFLKSNRLCGLCGNYNDLKNDDLVSESGKMLSRSEQMSAAWSRKKSCYNVETDPAPTLRLTNNWIHLNTPSSRIQTTIHQLSQVDKHGRNNSGVIDNITGYDKQHSIRKGPNPQKLISKNNLTLQGSAIALQIKQVKENKENIPVPHTKPLSSKPDSGYQIDERPRHHFPSSDYKLDFIIKPKQTGMIHGINHAVAENEKIHKLDVGKGQSQSKGGELSMLPNHVIKNNKLNTGKQRDTISNRFSGQISKGKKDIEPYNGMKTIEKAEDSVQSQDRSIPIYTAENTNDNSDKIMLYADHKDDMDVNNSSLNQTVRITLKKNMSAEYISNSSWSSNNNNTFHQHRWETIFNQTTKDVPLLKAGPLNEIYSTSGSSKSSREDLHTNEEEKESVPGYKHSVTTAQPRVDPREENRSQHGNNQSHSNGVSSNCSSNHLSSQTKTYQMCTQIRNWVLATCSGSFHIEDMMRTCLERMCSCKGDIHCWQNVVSEYASICDPIAISSRSMDSAESSELTAKVKDETRATPSHPP